MWTTSPLPSLGHCSPKSCSYRSGDPRFALRSHQVAGHRWRKNYTRPAHKRTAKARAQRWSVWQGCVGGAANLRKGARRAHGSCVRLLALGFPRSRRGAFATALYVAPNRGARVLIWSPPGRVAGRRSVSRGFFGAPGVVIGSWFLEALGRCRPAFCKAALVCGARCAEIRNEAAHV